MERHSHGDIAAIERGNWWYTARREVIADTLAAYAPKEKGTTLDLGCGVGANIDLLAPYASRVVGLEPSPEALAFAKERGYAELFDAPAEHLPLPDASVSLVLAGDVLEHVDDVSAVRELYRVLVPGGRVVATVPAYQALWSENDDYGQHLRRYTMRGFRELFTNAHLTVVSAHFWNFSFALPLWFVARFYQKKPEGTLLVNNLSRIPSPVSTPILWWMRLEHFVAQFIPLPVGVSIVLVAEKPL